MFAIVPALFLQFLYCFEGVILQKNHTQQNFFGRQVGAFLPDAQNSLYKNISIGRFVNIIPRPKRIIARFVIYGIVGVTLAAKITRAVYDVMRDNKIIGWLCFIAFETGQKVHAPNDTIYGGACK